MSWIALRMLTGDRSKYLGLVFGVTFATLLMTQQVSIFMGILTRTGNQILDVRDADIWVMDNRVRYLDEAPGLQDIDLMRVRGVPGVAWAVRSYKGIVRARLEDGNTRNVRLTGLDDETLVGAPQEMIVGSLEDLKGPDAVIIDNAGYEYMWGQEPYQLGRTFHKLASLGMLAAGVAHEIRNPLTAIKAWLFMHQKHLQAGTLEAADADIIAKEIDRLERIVRDFLQFARPSEPNRVSVPADRPLQEVQTLLMPQLEKANIRLVLDQRDSSPIRIDAEQIKQVLINLIQNAADAIGENGSVTLSARAQSKFLNGQVTDVVVLEVADTGKGIPPEVEKRLFDPFFTTKDGGTGLGLSIAAQILEKHGGALQYQTQVNHGTTFGVVLPRA